MKRLLPFILLSWFSLVSVNTFASQFNVFLFTKTTEWHHKSINAGVTALEEMAKLHHFTLEWHEDATLINDKNLERFDVVIFLSTTGDVMNESQQKSLQKFVRSGKGFVGIHSASDTEKNWPWFEKLVGRKFKIHPVIQTAKLNNLTPNFPGLENFAQVQWWTDEWYDFVPNDPAGQDNLRYLLSVDEGSYNTKSDWGDLKGDGMGEFHPISWFQNFQGGRSFYTALGHLPATYKTKQFQDHIYGGIFWAATGKGLD